MLTITDLQQTVQSLLLVFLRVTTASLFFENNKNTALRAHAKKEQRVKVIEVLDLSNNPFGKDGVELLDAALQVWGKKDGHSY